MKTKVYSNFSAFFVVLMLVSTNLFSQVPTITGPSDPVTGMPATLSNGVTVAQYFTEPGKTNYQWTTSLAGTITEGTGTDIITVTWNNPVSQQTVSVNYNENIGGPPTVLIINYYPFPGPIDPTTIPQFVDPLPHFAAGLRVNAKNGGNLVIKTFPVQQVALSKGTVVTGINAGTIGDPATPNAGLGNYAGYGISTDDGLTFPVKMWPAQTIETRQGFPVTVKYENGLNGITYDQFNILADQTLMMNGYQLTGNPLTDPYTGPIPMVVHLHGGEMPSGSDGGPNAWFMPGFTQTGPAFAFNQSSSSYYPNMQEATTLWYHPHDDGLTRINVYTGLAGYYFLRGEDEEAAKLPGWSGDDKVREITPAGTQYSPTFNGANTYLPEIEIAIQDRMFNVEGELYWPVAPPNPEIHPFWTPEFVGDIMTVNGKSWPYLSVAPRKYRFRMLEGCNARFLNMWLQNAADGTPGPAITVVGGEGGLLETPVVLDPSSAVPGTLLMAPGQRYDIIVDFTGLDGETYTLMNDAGAPYPFGDPVVPGLTDRIMQFVVNGELVSSADPAAPGTDKSSVAVLRPVNPLVKLTDFAGNLTPGVTPAVHRQILLNEVSAVGGPAAVLVNNTYFDAALSINPADPYRAGGPSEFPLEGTTELVEIINVSADAHPIHIHLLQWQLVSRRTIDDVAYLTEYANAWMTQQPGVAEFPAGLGYPGGAGTPFPYNTVNGNGAIGGNPTIPAAILGPVMPANPEEMGWKDNIIVLPGEVTTFVVRVAPTDRPVNATQEQLLFPFDPSLGPGFVWHCHIIDHEDMSMMRPLPVLPSALRYPQITKQPASTLACIRDQVKISVTATSATAITYQWQVSNDNGITWTDLVKDLVYSGVKTSSLRISSATMSLNGNLYQCVLSNIDGETTTEPALLTVSNCSVSGTIRYSNQALEPLPGLRVTINGLSAKTDASGAFTINGVTSGNHPVVISNPYISGGINSTDAGSVNAWAAAPFSIPSVKYLAGDVNKNSLSAQDAMEIQNYFVKGTSFVQSPWVYADASATTMVIPPALRVTVNGSSITEFGILASSAGDFNHSYTDVTSSSNATLACTDNSISVPSGQPFNVSIMAAADMQVGAISLILNVPTNLVTVNNVTVAGSSVPVTWKFAGGVLKIGWNSTTPVNVTTGSGLVVISMTPKATFTKSQTLRITMTPSYLNELADGVFNPINNALLTVDNVKIMDSTPPSDLVLSASPNPATSTTNIDYTVPANGRVSLAIYNNNGLVVLPILSNENVIAGSYTKSGVDVSKLKNGNYFLRLTLVVAGRPQSISIKFVKQ